MLYWIYGIIFGGIIGFSAGWNLGAWRRGTKVANQLIVKVAEVLNEQRPPVYRNYKVRELRDGKWVDGDKVSMSDEMVEYFKDTNRNTTKILQLLDQIEDEEQ